MAETILAHLIKPNVNLECRVSRTTPTLNPGWAPVESIYEWQDFTYQNLTQRYASELAQVRVFTDPASAYQSANLNKLYSERSLSDVLCATNMFTVSFNLPSSQFIADSSRTVEELDIFPDCGAGDDSMNMNPIGRTKVIVFGDTKYLWPYKEAVDLVQNNLRRGYDEGTKSEIVAPLEQVQHYGRKNNTCLHFIITDEHLVVLRLHLSPVPLQTSPRPQRSARFQGHQRITSSSTMSEVIGSISDMSVDSKDLLPEIAGLEYTVIPWKRPREDGMTVNLALWCLVKLASEDNSLREDYDSLAPSPRSTIRISTCKINTPKESEDSNKGKAKATGIQQKAA